MPTVDDLTGFAETDYFPARWSGRDLRDDGVRKWQGRDSRMAGLYYQDWSDRTALGMEIMPDACLALRARGFVGNGRSNPSCAIAHATQWAKGECALPGGNFLYQRNDALQFCPPPG